MSATSDATDESVKVQFDLCAYNPQKLLKQSQSENNW